MGNYVYKFASTPQELTQALQLRFEVFKIELLGKTNSSSDSCIEKDDFDSFCEHLIIIDTTKNQVVGTYRLLLDSVAEANNGFYSETKFNIQNVRQLEGKLLEVGRSCIHKNYRNQQILNLLWQGITQYAIKHHVQYIFGNASLMTDDPQRISQYLK